MTIGGVCVDVSVCVCVCVELDGFVRCFVVSIIVSSVNNGD